MSSKTPVQRFADIVEASDRIRDFISGMDREAFEQDIKTVMAVERCLLIVSEAAVKLDDVAEKKLPGLPWYDIRGIGNRLRHDYDDIDPEILWNTVKAYLPGLRESCRRLVENSEEKDG